MKRFITITSALALVGSVSYAMEEDKMDEMMEAEAPSVVVAGSGAIGFKHVSMDNDSDSEKLQLIRAYKVSFSSSGTTDGGLVFGAGMSIRDDTGEENMPVVKGSNVYIGSADGTWKLKFGGNDAGALLAGGIGISDDFLDEGNTSIGFEGSFGGTSYRLTVADPKATGDDDGDWSVGVKHSLGDVSIGLGMDNNSGLAIGLGSEISGVNVSAFYAQNERDAVPGVEATMVKVNDADGEVMGALGADFDVDDLTLSGDHVSSYKQEHKGMGAKASMSAGEGVTFSIAYSTHKIERLAVSSSVDDLPEQTVILVASKRAQEDRTSLAVGGLVIKDDDGVVYDVSSLITNTAGVLTFTTEAARTQARNGLDSEAGYFPSFTLDDVVILDAENLEDYQVAQSDAVEEVTGTVKKQTVSNNGIASDNDWKKIELDFTYDLGGGASLNAGVDQLDKDGQKTTTLEAKLAFSF